MLQEARATGHVYRVYNLGFETIYACFIFRPFCFDTIIYQSGTGRGYSVLEMVAAMEKACGHKIATKIGQRRPGLFVY